MKRGVGKVTLIRKAIVHFSLATGRQTSLKDRLSGHEGNGTVLKRVRCADGRILYVGLIVRARWFGAKLWYAAQHGSVIGNLRIF
jgi:hypothetical protein